MKHHTALTTYFCIFVHIAHTWNLSLIQEFYRFYVFQLHHSLTSYKEIAVQDAYHWLLLIWHVHHVISLRYLLSVS